MNKYYLRIKKSSQNGLIYRIYIEESINDIINKNRKGNNSESKKKSSLSKDHSLFSQIIDEDKKKNHRKYLSSIHGWRLNLAEPYIKERLKELQKRKKSQQKTLTGDLIQIDDTTSEIQIPEEDGVHFALLFRSSSRIQKMNKIDRILLNVKSMSHEEAYYWYSKIFTGGKRRIGEKSFRILMAN